MRILFLLFLHVAGGVLDRSQSSSDEPCFSSSDEGLSDTPDEPAQSPWAKALQADVQRMEYELSTNDFGYMLEKSYEEPASALKEKPNVSSGSKRMSRAEAEMRYRKGVKNLLKDFKEEQSEKIKEMQQLLGNDFPKNAFQLELTIKACSDIGVKPHARRAQELHINGLKKLLNNMYIKAEKGIEDLRNTPVTKEQIEFIKSRLKDFVDGLGIRIGMEDAYNAKLGKRNIKSDEDPCPRFRELVNAVDTLFESKLREYVQKQIARLARKPAILEKIFEITKEFEFIDQLKDDVCTFKKGKGQLFDELRGNLQESLQKKVEDYFQVCYAESEERMGNLTKEEATYETIIGMIFEVNSIKKSRDLGANMTQDKGQALNDLLRSASQCLQLNLEKFNRSVEEQIRLLSEERVFLDLGNIIYIDDTQESIRESAELLEKMEYPEPSKRLNEIILGMQDKYTNLFLNTCSEKFDLSIESISAQKAKLVGFLELFREGSIFTEESLRSLEANVTHNYKAQFNDLLCICRDRYIRSMHEQNYGEYLTKLGAVKETIKVIEHMLEHGVFDAPEQRAQHIKTMKNWIVDPGESSVEILGRIKAAHKKDLNEALYGLRIKYTGPISRNHQKLTLKPDGTEVSTSNGDNKIDASVLVPSRNVFIESMLLDLLVCNPDEYNDKVVIASNVLSNRQFTMVEWLQKNLADKTMDEKLKLVSQIMEAIEGINKDFTSAKLTWLKRAEREAGPEFSGLTPCDTAKEALKSANGIYYGFTMPEHMHENTSQETLRDLHILSKRTMTLDAILTEYLRNRPVQDGYLLSSVLPEIGLREILTDKRFEFILGSDEYDGDYKNPEAKKFLETATIIRNQHTKFIVWREGNKITCITGSLNFSASSLGLCPEGRLENVCIFTQTFPNETKATVFMKQFTEFKEWILEQE